MRGVVELWREPDGTWRWRWSGGDGLSILANRRWDRREQAVDAAARAYPGEPLALLERPPRAAYPRPARPAGARRLAVALAAAATATLVAGVVVALVRVTGRGGRRRPRPLGNLLGSRSDLRKPTRR